MHRNSQLLFERYARKYFKRGMRVLEIGPDHIPSHYATAVRRAGLVWHTADMQDNPQLTYSRCEEYRFPIPDGEYDVVVSGQVLEHVRKIWVWIKEVARVCKPGGLVITINPVSWPYHEAPVDCWRIYPEGMRTLYEEAQLDVLMSKCESAEAKGFSRVIAGRGRDWQGPDELERTQRLAPLGAPVECAFDTITIGRKPKPGKPAQVVAAPIARSKSIAQPKSAVGRRTPNGTNRRAKRKVFIDCGVREGDGIAAFLGDRQVGNGAYARCLKPRRDAAEFEFIGFESPDYRHLEATRDRFSEVNFALVEKLVWTCDGTVPFDSDGDSLDCRLLEVSCLDGGIPWRHPNPTAEVRNVPCIDLARFLLDEFTDRDYVALKLDIEGAEYDVLDRLLKMDALSRVRELYVEYHWWGRTSLRDQIDSRLREHPKLYYRDDWP